MPATGNAQGELMDPPRKIAAEEGPSHRVAVFAEENENEFEPIGRSHGVRGKPRSMNAKTSGIR